MKDEASKLKKEDIEHVLNAMADAFAGDAEKVYLKVADQSFFEKARQQLAAGEMDNYIYLSQLPVENLIDSMVSAVVDDPNAQFLVRHHQFMEGHLTQLFESFEGFTYSADKSSNIMRCVYNFFVNKKPIVFNYDQQYTYHLPEKILLDQESVLAWFDATQRLYYGKFNPYLLFIKDLAFKLNNPPEKGA